MCVEKPWHRVRVENVCSSVYMGSVICLELVGTKSAQSTWARMAGVEVCVIGCCVSCVFQLAGCKSMSAIAACALLGAT